MNPAPEGEKFVKARAAMVQKQLIDRGIDNPRVLSAMGRIPRQRFIAPRLARQAYDDGPLAIGGGQTISQPYIVGLMTQLLDPQPDDRMLEIGLGSGYQTAILAEIVREVFAVERVQELATSALELLNEMGYANVQVLFGDGTLGYPGAAPYNGILVAAAGPDIPPALANQLADGGRLVMPVGAIKDNQILVRLTRNGAQFTREQVLEVRFVPLIGQHGFSGEQP